MDAGSEGKARQGKFICIAHFSNKAIQSALHSFKTLKYNKNRTKREPKTKIPKQKPHCRHAKSTSQKEDTKSKK